MSLSLTAHDVFYAPQNLVGDVCDFCRYMSRSQTLRRAVVIVRDNHGTHTALCLPHVGPALEAIANGVFSMHRETCAVCATERVERETEMAEKRRLREAKKKQPSALTGGTE